MFADHSETAGFIPVDDEFLAQKLDGIDWFLFGQFGDSSDGVPIPAQKLAPGRSGPNTRQEFIFFTFHGTRLLIFSLARLSSAYIAAGTLVTTLAAPPTESRRRNV